MACCDAKAEAVARFQTELGLADGRCFTNYDEFIAADMDIVSLGTPMPFHAEQAVKALGGGKHVLSEVTMASTLEEC